MNEPSNAPMYDSAPAEPPNDSNRIMAIASLVLGIINLCAWLFPICGAPLAIVGLVLGYFGLKSPAQKTLATIGMALSGIALLLACVNAVAGIVFGPQIQEILESITRGY